MRWNSAAITASAAGLVVAGAVLAMGLADHRDGDAGDGPGMHIALFTPPEPTPVAGPVMDVGPVVDGYEHHPYVQEAAYEPETAWLPEDEPYAPLPEPEFRPVRVETPYVPAPPPVEPEPEARPRSRWSFGFEQRLPDFAAERRERRERRARMEAFEGYRTAEVQAEPAPGPDHLDPAARRSPDMFY
jgi:hypothetical protein